MRLLLLRIALLLVIGIDTGLLLTLTPVRLFFINAQYGCYPWSPAEVLYRDGMTLCPGQAVRMQLKIPLPAPTDKGI